MLSQTKKPKIELTEDQAELFANMVNKKFELSCDTIAQLWREHWTACPLCGAVEDDTGLIIHQMVQ